MNALGFEVVANDGRCGAARLGWLLLCDGELISHSDTRQVLEGDLDRLKREAFLRVCLPVVFDEGALGRLPSGARMNPPAAA